MQTSVLNNRLEALGINPFQLAKLVAEMREKQDGVERDPRNLSSSVKKALTNPGRSRLETIEEIVAALDGEIVIRWKKYERVERGFEEISLIEGVENEENNS